MRGADVGHGTDVGQVGMRGMNGGGVGCEGPRAGGAGEVTYCHARLARHAALSQG